MPRDIMHSRQSRRGGHPGVDHGGRQVQVATARPLGEQFLVARRGVAGRQVADTVTSVFGTSEPRREITRRTRVVHQIHDVAQVERRAGHLHRVSVERHQQVLQRLRPLEGELARVNRTLISLIMRPYRRGSRTCRFVRVHPQ